MKNGGDSVAFGGVIKLEGEQEYRRALTQIQDKLSVVGAQMGKMTASFDSNSKSVEALSTKNKLLEKRLTEQKDALGLANGMLSKAKDEYNKAASSADKWRSALNDAKSSLEKSKASTETSAEKMKKLEKAVKDSEKSLADAENEVYKHERAVNKWTVEQTKAETAVLKTTNEINSNKEAMNRNSDAVEDNRKKVEKNDAAHSKWHDTLGKVATALVATGTAAATAAAAGIAKLSTEAIKSYSEYEQLVGGVETLFKDSASTVQDNAAQAYRTAGISANNYMEQATSFSATLLQGLGGDTAKAAEYADLAIRDMSDNANKMGTDISSIQNAYQGFAKDNYTMLDNLKLGYGGTQEEMARLVNETKVLGEGIEVDAKSVKDVPFDKIIEAIHKVQEDLGITGTTAKEAADTIQGSAGSMKAAWDNLLIGFSDDTQDFDMLLDNFTASVEAAVKNIAPRVVDTIPRVIQGSLKLGDKLIEMLPAKYQRIIKPIIESGEKAAKKAIDFADKAIPKIGKAMDYLPKVLDVMKKMLPLIGGITAGFAAWNIASKVIVVVETIKKMSTAIKAAATAQQLLNVAMAENPAGMIAVAVGLLVTAIIAYKSATKEAKTETDEFVEAEKERQQAIKDVYDSIEDSIAQADDNAYAIQTQYDKVEDLWQELDKLTDANGRVKESDKDRASYILGELNDALGTEYSMTDNLIENYGNLKNEIQGVIDKKRALSLYDNYASEEADLMKKQTTSQRGLSDTRAQLADERLTLEKHNKAIDDLQRKGLRNWNEDDAVLYEKAKKGAEEAQKRLDSLAKTYKEQNDVYYATTEQLDKLRNAETAIAEERYEDAIQILTFSLDANKQRLLNEKATNQEVVDAYNDSLTQIQDAISKANEAKAKGYEADAEQQIKTQLKTFLEIYELAKKNGLSSSQIWTSKFKQSVKQLADNGFDISALVDHAAEDGQDIGIVLGENWREVVQNQLDSGYDITGLLNWAASSGYDVSSLFSSKFMGTMQQNLDGGFDLGGLLQWAQEKGKNIGEVFGENFKSVMTQYIYATNDLINRNSVNSASDARIRNGEEILKINWHAKAMDRPMILEKPTIFGMQNGRLLGGGEAGNEVVAGEAKLMSMIRSAVSTDGNIVGQFKEALSQMRIEMDDREMGRFVDKTIAASLYT